MRTAIFPTLFVLASGLVAANAAAEEFKYYVWIDDEGIVHAAQEAPKGRDYKVRIIEDINANVVPAEDFRLFGDLPVDYSEDEPGSDESAPTGTQEDPQTTQRETTAEQ